jgi:hypothetical protein
MDTEYYQFLYQLADLAIKNYFGTKHRTSLYQNRIFQDLVYFISFHGEADEMKVS